MVNRIAFAVPGDLETPTGGYGYDRRIIRELRALGWQVDVVSLGEGFPQPSAEQRAFALSRLLSLPQGVPVVVDGLALGALPQEAEKIVRRAPLVALVHHPLALETGLSRADAQLLLESERRALAAARAVIVTSPYTARQLSENYGVQPDSITVAPPGTDRGPAADGVSASPLRSATPPPALFPPPFPGEVARRAGGGGMAGPTVSIVRLLSVGAVVPRKGFDILIAALAPIAGLPWRLNIAGDLTRDVAAVAALRADITRHRLIDRVGVLGAMSQDRLADLYASSDIFVLASHFEGYGMAYAEAMVHGLPIIGTTGGATVDTVPPSAGLLLEPGNVEALTRALRLLIEKEKERRRLASGALAAAASLPAWQNTAQIVAAALEGLA